MHPRDYIRAMVTFGVVVGVLLTLWPVAVQAQTVLGLTPTRRASSA